MIPGGTTGARVEIFSTNGTHVRILRAPSAAAMTSAPVWTAQGREIVYATSGAGRDASLRRLTDDVASDWDPAYTPDGKSILWSSNRSGNFEIWMAAADGSAARQVTHDGVDAENPVMMPDGQWILHWSNNPEKRGLWKVRPDGSSATRILTRPVGAPEISPDGVYFALGDNTPGEQRHISVYRVADGSRVPFTIVVEKNGSLDPNFGRLRWMPSGKAIAFSGNGPDRLSGVFDFVPGQDTSATRRRLAGFAEAWRPSPSASPPMASRSCSRSSSSDPTSSSPTEFPTFCRRCGAGDSKRTLTAGHAGRTIYLTPLMLSPQPLGADARRRSSRACLWP